MVYNTYRKVGVYIMIVFNLPKTREGMKHYIYRNKLLIDKCSICGLEPIWNNKKLILQIDHINGVNNDHRLENLRLLCPNCHSQTDTFAGHNVKKNIRPTKCTLCHNIISRRAKLCLSCSAKTRKRKTNWPTKEELEKLIWEKPTTHIAKKYGVSDKAIAKWCKKYNIKKPPRGYWSQNHYGDNSTW